ncbi:hypothetical protein RRV45_14065 [Bacillus sp. DTU_2020_1000418_1_SI_GHA_SEK_038]|uniref:hypothetical protein n=1 Tax=Bacillus sp. DTU_2020_1000418_1_SI_GHA_SEK_038 TaxID=3077585 RepID=UPI0028ECE2FA|nr:hypothetical protein [Bacillus sp. DTU_2020_1000418_1_SI_GHA_SEK_038]WNS74041.1 hypothetical protein RRV45_14065 [Bacillus sp. DTU_2020_1000418_1_SI_GHA_SEK_038]
MKKVLLLLASLLLFIPLLAGCMYPKGHLAQNKVPYEDQIKAVQTAVNSYKEANGGLLPIKTKDETTPIYQKYLIDFKKLIPHFMAEPPGNAYESGGVFQYILIDVETEPTVKIFDLRMAETIRDIKLRIKSQKYPPYKEQIAGNVFTLDFTKLGYKENPVALSPYSGRNLPFVITGEAEVYVDYTSDLHEAMQKQEISYKQGDDVREILTKDSAFVPAYSLPYTIDNETKNPIFLSK